jgi:ATP-dependent exoDNAse (exonuclease V) beta subunit
LPVSDLADVDQFLALLDDLDDGGDLPRLETLSERLEQLFAAADAGAGPELQLMTVHKAKGLEFDTVILPGLGRAVGKREPALLLWQEDPEHGLLLAPIPPAGSDQPQPTYLALAGIHRDKDELETLRLFYVAATRARCALHLLGHTAIGKDGRPATPASGSLLGAVWKTLQGELSYPTVAIAVAPPDRSASSGIRRLPVNWSPPALAGSLPVVLPGSRRASAGGSQDTRRLSLSLQTEEGRIVGNAVHLWLERIAADGAAGWSCERLATLSPQLSAVLAGGGVPASRLAPCVARVLQALRNTLASQRGLWVLAAHREAASELALSGVINGELVHAVIDRTFFDNEGTRWIIDYKTTEPAEGETVEEFLERERDHYRPQLEVYKQLLQQWSPRDHVCTALYFPLLDAWCEVG